MKKQVFKRLFAFVASVVILSGLGLYANGADRIYGDVADEGCVVICPLWEDEYVDK